METASLLLGVLLSAAGLGLLVYGRRQQSITPFICGLGLMLAPYVIDDVWLLAGVGVALVAVPLWLGR
jgi:hypothetical protein